MNPGNQHQPHHHPQHHYATPPHHNNNNPHFLQGLPPIAPFQQAPSQTISRKRSVSNESEEQAWHCFKRLRLQTSDDSSHQSSSGDDSVYNNHRRQNNINGFSPGGRLNEGSHPETVYYNHHPNLQQQHQQRPGEATSSSDTLHSQAAGEEYSRVNHFLGLLHKQRRERTQQEGAAATSEWQSHQPTLPHPSYHPHNASARHLHRPAGQQGKQQHFYAVRLPSDSKLL